MISREDLIEVRKKLGTRKLKKQVSEICVQFVKELIEAGERGEVTLPNDLIDQLEDLETYLEFITRLSPGRKTTYTPEDRAAFVDLVNQLSAAGHRDIDAIRLANEQLWPDDPHKKANDSQYYIWRNT